jgi:hypothetical protein
MLFRASDLLGRTGVRPVLDPGVLAGSEGELAVVGLAAAPPDAAVRCGRGGCSPGISPFDVMWHPASAIRPIVTMRTSGALTSIATRCHGRDRRHGKPDLCGERTDRDGGSGTGRA